MNWYELIQIEILLLQVVTVLGYLWVLIGLQRKSVIYKWKKFIFLILFSPAWELVAVYYLIKRKYV